MIRKQAIVYGVICEGSAAYGTLELQGTITDMPDTRDLIQVG
jgi:hypothetical protein